MGIVSTTRTIVACVSALLVAGGVGFSLNAYLLYLLRCDLKRVERELVLLRATLPASTAVAAEEQPDGSSAREDEEDEDDFQLALESIPSQCSIFQGPDIACDDLQCLADLSALCRDLDERHDKLKHDQVLCRESLVELKRLNGEQSVPQLRWRLVRVMFEIGKHQSRAGVSAKEILLEGLGYAKEAVEMGENNSKCHLWYAILLGDTCKYDDTKTKLTKGMEFETHVKRSLELDPYNSTALHLLGRYCFEVSGIKWWEAKIAVTLFGHVPQSSYEEALEYFLKASDLNSEWTENLLFVVKCQVALGRSKEAARWAAKIKAKPVDPDILSQLESLQL